jgi:ADP-glucose pyrophosphorylase
MLLTTSGVMVGWIQQTPTDKSWFQGTADAVRQYSWLLQDIKNKNVQDVVILSGDHLYRMDYSDFIKTHRSTNADITVSCLPMDDSRATDFGLMKVRKPASGRATGLDSLLSGALLTSLARRAGESPLVTL